MPWSSPPAQVPSQPGADPPKHFGVGADLGPLALELVFPDSSRYKALHWRELRDIDLGKRLLRPHVPEHHPHRLSNHPP
jgi:hypothetical protein